MGKKLQKKKNRYRNDPSHARGRDSYNFHLLNDSGHDSEEANEDDLISNLPDEIIFYILSLTTLDSALQTTALSTEWRTLWNRSNVQHGIAQDIDCAVGDLILDFDEFNPSKDFGRLQFCFSDLILIAAIGLRKKLHLDFSTGKQYGMRKFEWKLVLNSVDPTHQPAPYAFFIKTLKLTSVSYLTSHIISSLVSNFQSLESLTLSKCKGLYSLHIDVVSKLLSLTVLDCPDLISVSIEAYDLQILRYRGRFCRFILQGVHSLEDVMLDFRDGSIYTQLSYRDHRALLQATRDVKILTLCQWTFKVIVNPWLYSIFGPWLSIEHQNFRFMKLKDLWWIDNSLEECNIKALLSFLKFCPLLERLFINIDQTNYSTPHRMTKCCNEEGWRARLRHLKVVKLEGSVNKQQIISLKEYLLKVFHVEPRIVVAMPGSNPRCLIRIPKQQSNVKMQVQSEMKYPYKFVEEVEHNIGLCSPHAHMIL